ncbi:MAG TPA: ATP-grasp domain-containing protein [Polyangiaceae bacterium LLY-WYZ-15_(1-7)]|nr:D-alanine--D-alanine ligase [Sandaracinus sp.]MBJ72151.1 D-alanine--D-alanine ligase [Sandaracinus sp.]HJL01362.1 ATP-grasp domain-containing protein [Polyangiaceae bacterium LLY-WYZ-15_(1-7)]HJL09516.1 ATP-grasp domain-containing protein [Polyangiaceae bacterium LLY-WYZ-15_(1-7)]
MPKLRVLQIVHETLVPPPTIEGLPEEEFLEVKTEWDVKTGLEELGHTVMPLGLRDELAPLRRAIDDWEPDVVFNLLEEFHGEVLYDAYVASYLELKRVAYTGCNPRGLILARDKALSKKVLAYHRIPVPRFAVFPRGRKVRRPKSLAFPVIVKSLVAEGSEGIAQASVVTSDEALAERVAFVHRTVGTDAVAEQFIDGRELYVAVLGNHRLRVLPTWELFLDGLPADAPRIATRKVKWDVGYQKKHGIDIGPARPLPEEVERKLPKLARRICRALNVDGYVRIDFRLTPEGKLYFLEANPNPDVAWGEEFASAAEAAGLDYEALLDRIVKNGLRRARG